MACPTVDDPPGKSVMPESAEPGQSVEPGRTAEPGQSAVIVPIDLPAQLAAVRALEDPMARLGVPAHVTILFPFLPTEALTPAVRSVLAGVAAEASPFTALFERVERREQMVWLVPTDQEPFLRLTERVSSLWPEHPPYGGAHDELVAHLTLVDAPTARLQDAVHAEAVKAGPFEVRVDELAVVAETPQGTWRTRWRLPLDH